MARWHVETSTLKGTSRRLVRAEPGTALVGWPLVWIWRIGHIGFMTRIPTVVFPPSDLSACMSRVVVPKNVEESGLSTTSPKGEKGL
jgi:hypothetical protein